MKKYWCLGLICLYALVMYYSENILGAAWTTIATETNVSLNNMNGGSSLNYLLLGFTNLIWIPVAMKFGRRLVYLSSLVIQIGGQCFTASFHGVGQWYGACLVGGIGTAACDALVQLTVSWSAHFTWMLVLMQMADLRRFLCA